MVCLPLRGHWVGVPGRIWLFLCFYNMKQNRKQLFDPFWAPRVRLFHDNYKVVVVKKLIFGHFGLEIGPLWPGNRNKNPWDYKTRAQELTSGAIRMFLSLFVKIWEHFKDGAEWWSFCRMNFGVKIDSFYKFGYISALDGPILKKLVTKLKIFWCSNWFW